MKKALAVILMVICSVAVMGSKPANAGMHLFAVPQTGSSGHSVALTCTPGVVASGQDPATSFNFKRSATTGGPYALEGSASTCAFTDTNVSAGQKWFYIATGVNAGGESGPSNEVSATIPTFPPPTPGSLAAIPK